MIQRERVLELVQASVETALGLSSPEQLPAPIVGGTVLFGEGAILDSVALVAVIVDLEQRLEEAYGHVLTLADDAALSSEDSPFSTVESLVAYVTRRLLEAHESR